VNMQIHLTAFDDDVLQSFLEPGLTHKTWNRNRPEGQTSLFEVYKAVKSSDTNFTCIMLV
jgi:hypothetical protein